MDKEVKISKLTESDLVCQGDVFQSVKYYFSIKEDNDGVDIIELTFPFVVVLSQACDTYFMSDLVNKSTSSQPSSNKKFMYSYLVAPIYNLESLKSGDFFVSDLPINMRKEPQFNSKEKEIAASDMHYRYYLFKSSSIYDNNEAVIDFKHYFTLNAIDLMAQRVNRVGNFDREHTLKIVNKFAAFLTRVGITDDNQQ